MNYKELILKEILKNRCKQFTKVELKKILNVEGKKGHNKLFIKDLKSLIKENVIIKNKKGKYNLNNSFYNLFLGKFIQTDKGFNFCVSVSKNKKEIREVYINKNNIKNSMHGDFVLVEITKKNQDGKAEGKVISVLTRAIKTLVGTFIKDKKNNFAFVIPDNSKINYDIYIPNNCFKTAKNFDKVIVNITRYPEGDRKPEGIISEILGFKYDIGIDYLSIINEYNFKEVFNPKVLQQVEKIKEKISDYDLKGRRNLTDMCIFTIDGEDSKDLDDAVSIQRLKNGNYRLGVHIADVSHYVKEDTPLDKEALSRGTSIYMINKVIPMLPKKLSNNLCSLNPLTTKLTLSVFMDINKNGQVIKYDIFESYISSKSKLFYKNVSDFLEEKNDLKVSEEIKGTQMEFDIKNSLVLAKELKDILEKKRLRRGALDFQFAEACIDLDSEDRPVSVKAYERRVSNDIIEEFMIVTNETVAEHFNKLEIPFVYRVHEKPKQEKIEQFLGFVRELGYDIRDEISVENLQYILKQAEGKIEEEAVNLLLLQCMEQAKYLPDELGHFGLGSSYYSHFTSPIRRYPDLQIHRIIKDYLNGKINKVRIEQLRRKVTDSSRISSKRERQAEKCENEYKNLKKAEFMEDKINNVFDGIITGISRFNCKVTLDNTIEGEVSLNKVNDEDFKVLREGCSLIGLTSNRKITIGDKVKVRLVNVNLEEQLIIFKFEDFK